MAAHLPVKELWEGSSRIEGEIFLQGFKLRLTRNILSGFWWWGCWGGNWCIDRAAHVSEEDRCNCADIILGKQLYNWTDTLFKYCFILGIEEDSLGWDSFLPRYPSNFWSWLPLSLCILEVMLTLFTWSTVSVEVIDQVDSGVGAFETPGRSKRGFVHLQPNKQYTNATMLTRFGSWMTLH